MSFDNTNAAHAYPEGGGKSVWSDTPSLIQACIAGNREAQKKLYDTYSPAAYSLIRRYTRHEEIAAEILNDAFFKILTKLDKYSFEGAFEGWIRTIVVNTVTDHMRKHIKKKEREVMVEEPFSTSSDNRIEADLSYKELLAVIQELPDMQRAVFNLHVFESMKHRDIAQVLDTSEGTSRWYLNDARKRLQEKINLLMKR